MTASITRSRSLKSASAVVPRMRPRVVFASSSESLPALTTRASEESIARETLVDELLIDVAREHVETRGSAHLRDPRAHLTETDDSDALDGHGVRPPRRRAA